MTPDVITHRYMLATIPRRIAKEEVRSNINVVDER